MKMSVGNNLEPEANTEENKSLLAKLKGYFILLMVTLMGLGNWADSKALIIEGYNGFITHFTNQIEEKKITALDIGNYLPIFPVCKKESRSLFFQMVFFF